jgi:hypothetical protein
VNELFTSLTQAVEGAPSVAILASFVWGVLSILLSPCHLASIPLIVGFIDEQGRISTRRAGAARGRMDDLHYTKMINDRNSKYDTGMNTLFVTSDCLLHDVGR